MSRRGVECTCPCPFSDRDPDCRCPDIAALDAQGAALASAFEARTASMERLTAADLSTKVGGE